MAATAFTIVLAVAGSGEAIAHDPDDDNHGHDTEETEDLVSEAAKNIILGTTASIGGAIGSPGGVIGIAVGGTAGTLLGALIIEGVSGGTRHPGGDDSRSHQREHAVHKANGGNLPGGNHSYAPIASCFRAPGVAGWQNRCFRIRYH